MLLNVILKWFWLSVHKVNFASSWWGHRCLAFLQKGHFLLKFSFDSCLMNETFAMLLAENCSCCTSSRSCWLCRGWCCKKTISNWCYWSSWVNENACFVIRLLSTWCMKTSSTQILLFLLMLLPQVTSSLRRNRCLCLLLESFLYKRFNNCVSFIKCLLSPLLCNWLLKWIDCIELTDSFMIEAIHTFESFLTDSFLMICEEETSELLSLEKVLAVILWLWHC